MRTRTCGFLAALALVFVAGGCTTGGSDSGQDEWAPSEVAAALKRGYNSQNPEYEMRSTAMCVLEPKFAGDTVHWSCSAYILDDAMDFNVTTSARGSMRWYETNLDSKTTGFGRRGSD
jgi:hypothetical protein